MVKPARTTPLSLALCGRAGSEKWHAIGARSVVSPMSELSQTEKNSVRAYILRFAPESGHCAMQSARPFRARKADMPDTCLMRWRRWAQQADTYVLRHNLSR